MANSSCQKCKNWHDCTAPPQWFNYAEVRFCPYQCIWIIQCKDILKAGRWPPEEGQAESPRGKSQFKTEASFVKPELIIGEVEARLLMTGIQGKLLLAQIETGRTLGNLDWEAREALMYISGWSRKTKRFSDWKKERRYRTRHTKRYAESRT